MAGTDRAARLRLRALWAVLGGFERLIGGEALRLAALGRGVSAQASTWIVPNAGSLAPCRRAPLATSSRR